MLAIWQNMWRKEIFSQEPTKEVVHEIVSSFYFPSLMNRPHHQMLGTPHSFMHTPSQLS